VGTSRRAARAELSTHATGFAARLREGALELVND